MGNPTTTPPPARCPSWCAVRHTPSHLDHAADVGMWDLGGSTIEIILRQAPEGGPVARVMFGPDWAPPAILDIPVRAAAQLGEVIGMLTVPTYTEFGRALARAAALAGEAGR